MNNHSSEKTFDSPPPYQNGSDSETQHPNNATRNGQADAYYNQNPNTQRYPEHGVGYMNGQQQQQPMGGNIRNNDGCMKCNGGHNHNNGQGDSRSGYLNAGFGNGNAQMGMGNGQQGYGNGINGGYGNGGMNGGYNNGYGNMQCGCHECHHDHHNYYVGGRRRGRRDREERRGGGGLLGHVPIVGGLLRRGGKY